MEIKKLLFATDFEKPDFAQVERLLVFRKLGLEEVVFLHPVLLQDWEKRIADRGLKAKTSVRDGPILSRIWETTQQEKISLVAVNMKREETKIFVGPVAKKLLRSSPVPVILMNQDAQMVGAQEKEMFRHIIFATDWSPTSEAVLNVLLDFKEITHTLELVNVISRKLSVREMRNLKKKLVETRNLFLDRGIDAEAHVYAGKPAEEIMLAARDYKATSIVMGASRKSPFEAFFSPGCAYRVAQEAAVPILVIPYLKGE